MKNMRILWLGALILFAQVTYSQQKEPSNKSLMDKARDTFNEYNPFKKDSSPPVDSKPAAPELAATPAPAEPPAPPKRKLRNHLFAGFGNVALQGNSGSVIETDYSPSAGGQMGMGFEFPVSEKGSFETGLTFLVLGSKLKHATNTDMSLSYFAIPLVYKHEVSKVSRLSNFYLKGGLLPMILLNASVDSCESVLCGNDSDLDAWLRKSRSISNSFQKYSLMGTAGAGFNFLLFRDFLIDSLWFNTDLSYVHGLTKINRGSELGREVHIAGVIVTLGLAISF